ncbi:MAG TPA: HAD family hydrolase [Phycisphaerae bacterium]|nr:HAD family hydrolase [Phycisphaerae bacterium]HNU46619.1 HAD family hydrolase [Phycisphaerae bacterium]
MARMQAVIFDLDDTLYPERQYVLGGYAAVASAFADRLGDPRCTLDHLCRLFNTEHRPRVFNRLLLESGLPEDAELVVRMIATYRGHRPTLTLHADAEAVLARLERRVPLGLVTDGPAAVQAAKIEALGLTPRFAQIVLTDTLGPEGVKPSARAFELIAQRLDVEHRACVHVGDNLAKDFLAPNRLGWVTVRVLRPEGVHWGKPAPPGGEPQHTVASLEELPQLLPGLPWSGGTRGLRRP